MSAPETSPDASVIGPSVHGSQRLGPIAGWIALVAALAIGLWLRISVASGPLWLDELHTSWCIEGKLSSIAPRAEIGNQPPLYFWLTWLTSHIAAFGFPVEIALRALSLTAGLGLMLAAAWLVKRWTQSLASAAVAVGLIAIDPDFVFYATEARPYVVLQLLSVIQVSFFADFVIGLRRLDSGANGHSGRIGTLIGLTLLSVALFYVHYTSIWLHTTETVLFLALASFGYFSLNRSAYLETGIVVMATAAMIAPALPHLSRIVGQGQYWSVVSDVGALTQTLGWKVAIYFLLPALSGIVLCRLIDQPKKKRTQGSTTTVPFRRSTLIAIVFAWGCLPVLLVQGIAFTGTAPVAFDRYTQVGAAAFPIGTAVLLGTLTSSAKARCMATLLTLSLITLSQIQFVQPVLLRGTVPAMRFENWREPIEAINLDFTKNEQPLFLFANILEDSDALNNTEPSFQRYLKFPVQGIYHVDATERDIISGPTLGTDADLAKLVTSNQQLIERHRGAWILVRGTRPTVSLIANAFQDNFRNCRASFFESPESDVVLISLDLVD